MLIKKEKLASFLEHIKRHSEYIKEDEEESFNIINRKQKGDPGGCMWSLGLRYYALASKNLLIDKDIKSFKKNIYIYSKLEILGKDSRVFLWRSSVLLWAIMATNNPSLINFVIKYGDKIANISPENKYLKSDPIPYLTKVKVLALKGDWDEVIRRADIFLASPPKDPYYRYYYLEFEFLKALAEKNVDKMKECINTMLEKKVAKKMLHDMDGFFDCYLHIFVLCHLKTALYHGFDLGIDHELCPKELIDNTPAKEYPEPYDFMKDFNFDTITLEEWRAWLYKYAYDPEELRRYEEKGYLI